MPKLPVIAGPQVAPQPINLPGARRVYAGDGATALGGALQQGAAQVETVIDRHQKEADDEVAEKQAAAYHAEVNALMLDPKGGYRTTTLPSVTGPTRAGVSTLFLDKAKAARDRLGEKLSAEQRKAFDAKTAPITDRMSATLGTFEGQAVQDEYVATAMASFDAHMVEAGETALSLGTKDGDPDVKRLRLDKLEAEAMAQALKAAEVSGAPTAPTEAFLRKALTKFRANVAESIRAGVSAEAAQAYLTSTEGTPSTLTYAGTKLNVLVDTTNNDYLRQRQGLKDESRRTRIERMAVGAVADAQGNLVDDATTRATLAQAVKDDPTLVEFVPAVRERIAAIRKAAVEAEYDRNADMRLNFLAQVYAAVGAGQDIDGTNLSVGGTPLFERRGDVLVPTLDSKSTAEILRAAQAARPKTAPRGRSTTPPALDTPTAKGLWDAFSLLSTEQQARYTDPGSAIYRDLTPKQINVFVDEAVDAKARLERGYEKAAKGILKRVRAIALNRWSNPAQGDIVNKAVAIAETELKTLFDRDKTPSDEQLAQVVYAPFREVETFGRNNLRAEVPTAKPVTGGESEWLAKQGVDAAAERRVAASLWRGAQALNKVRDGVGGGGQFILVDGQRVPVTAAQAAKLRALPPAQRPVIYDFSE